jgi:hypothetical protein
MPEQPAVFHRARRLPADHAYADSVSRRKLAGERSRKTASRRASSRKSSRRAGRASKPYLVADVPPLDVDGVATVAIGTAAWALTFIALLPFYGALRDHGRVWLLWTCLAGFGLGLLGLEYCRRRRHYLSSRPRREQDSSPLGAAGL